MHRESVLTSALGGNLWAMRAIGHALVALQGDQSSAMHIQHMDELTEEAAAEIEQLHSSWINCEVGGESHMLMSLCADDIGLRPPGAQPVLGRTAVSRWLAHKSMRIHDIEITDRRIRGSNTVAYLTANYKTSFYSGEDSMPRQVTGSHLWILERRVGAWALVLVSWSVLGAALDAFPQCP
jgi:ketosteroid isomerase-like protein